ncbi:MULTISPECIES: hypothetical protein [unclassified Brachybacterium]|uniref:hypothetical protein n=1 Tax=unclassified Brachybacterium TaxID=2623841 RepID=UPI0040331664
MSPERGSAHDPRDVDAEFARMLESEGMVLRPGEAPHEPAARTPDPTDDAAGDDLWSYSAESPPEPPSAESRARARAAHPSARPPEPVAGPRDAPRPRELDDDEVLYGDFEPPDPDFPQPTSASLWSWTALIGGFLLLVIVPMFSVLPGILGWLGGLAALGGVISLLLRVPRSRHGDDDGAEL